MPSFALQIAADPQMPNFRGFQSAIACASKCADTMSFEPYADRLEVRTLSASNSMHCKFIFPRSMFLTYEFKYSNEEKNNNGNDPQQQQQDGAVAQQQQPQHQNQQLGADEEEDRMILSAVVASRAIAPAILQSRATSGGLIGLYLLDETPQQPGKNNNNNNRQQAAKSGPTHMRVMHRLASGVVKNFNLNLVSGLVAHADVSVEHFNMAFTLEARRLNSWIAELPQGNRVELIPGAQRFTFIAKGTQIAETNQTRVGINVPAHFEKFTAFNNDSPAVARPAAGGAQQQQQQHTDVPVIPKTVDFKHLRLVCGFADSLGYKARMYFGGNDVAVKLVFRSVDVPTLLVAPLPGATTVVFTAHQKTQQLKHPPQLQVQNNNNNNPFFIPNKPAPHQMQVNNNNNGVNPSAGSNTMNAAACGYGVIVEVLIAAHDGAPTTEAWPTALMSKRLVRGKQQQQRAGQGGDPIEWQNSTKSIHPQDVPAAEDSSNNGNNNNTSTTPKRRGREDPNQQILQQQQIQHNHQQRQQQVHRDNSDPFAAAAAGAGSSDKTSVNSSGRKSTTGSSDILAAASSSRISESGSGIVPGTADVAAALPQQQPTSGRFRLGGDIASNINVNNGMGAVVGVTPEHDYRNNNNQGVGDNIDVDANKQFDFVDQVLRSFLGAEMQDNEYSYLNNNNNNGGDFDDGVPGDDSGVAAANDFFNGDAVLGGALDFGYAVNTQFH